MNQRTIAWTSVIGGAALMLAGCVADTTRYETSGRSEPLSEALLDPTAPLGTGDVPDYVPFDAGICDASRHDIPGRDDDRTEVDDVPYEPVNERLPMTCGGASNDACPDGMICCPATHECVPESCPGCCNMDDYHRFTPIEAPAPEELPDVNPVGPPPEREGDPDGPGEDPDPGPMPPPPSAP